MTRNTVCWNSSLLPRATHRVASAILCVAILLSVSGGLVAQDAFDEFPLPLDPGGHGKKTVDDMLELLDPASESAAKPEPDAVAEHLSVDKLVYRFESPVSIRFNVRNVKARGPLRLRVELFHCLERTEVLLDKEQELAIGTAETFICSYMTGSRAQGAEYGYEVRVTVADGEDRESVKREYFMVTDNPLKIGHLTIPLACETVHTPAGGAAKMREMYFCMAESPFWVPCDWSGMATEREDWFSGQASRYLSQDGVKKMVQAVHDLGGWMLFYATKWASGPAGFEVARRHPEWFNWDYDWYGCTFNIPELEWKARPPREAGKAVSFGELEEGGGLPAILALVQKPEVAEYGIEQIAGSVRRFGWDGIRLDSGGWYVERDLRTLTGEPVLPPDAVTAAIEAELVEKMKAGGRAVNPHFVYGVNSGWPTDIETASPKFLAEAKGGGLIMDEGMARRTRSAEGDTWDVLRAYLRDAIPTVRKAGGYPYGIVGFDNEAGRRLDDYSYSPDRCIFYGILFGSGMHLCYGTDAEYLQYMRLYARHCGLLYDDALEFIENPDGVMSVTSPRPLWWKDYVRRRELTDGSIQYIVHLINPSTGDRYNKIRNDPPEAQEEIKIALAVPDGIRIEKGFRVTADELDGPDVLPLPEACRSEERTCCAGARRRLA